MNVLILTPDAVGSTLLQRMLTIYMQFHKFDRPVINLQELTNGLVRRHSTKFGQDVLGKQADAWGYHQSLEEIVSMLSSVDHYKTSRLAHYHIVNRQDTLADQLSFYRYLNKNFYIISCRRHNIFEHALSWCLSKVTKKLNVYADKDKINSFFDYYVNGIDLDPNSLIQSLQSYKNYIDWCNSHFEVANYFLYEEHLPNIERYILNLPMFQHVDESSTWQSRYGISFNQWNLCHYMGSDIGTLALDRPAELQRLSNQINYEVKQISTMPAGTDLADVTSTALAQNITQLLPQEHQDFLQTHRPAYYMAMNDIWQMVQDGVITSCPPIKKQTLAEKKHMIRNYQHLLSVYNIWIAQYPELGQPLDDSTLDEFAQRERKAWQPSNSNMAVVDPQNIPRF